MCGHGVEAVAGAFRDLFLMRNGTMMRAIIVGLAIMAPVFALIESRAVPESSFGALAAGAHVVPLGVNLAVGGVLFGIGMVVAGGCVSGTLYRIGEGYLASWVRVLVGRGDTGVPKQVRHWRAAESYQKRTKPHVLRQ